MAVRMGEGAPRSRRRSWFGKGHDKLGAIHVQFDECSRCGEEGVCVRWLGKMKISDYAKKANSLILKKKDKQVLGITCGCYSRFHRQLAYIECGRRRK